MISESNFIRSSAEAVEDLDEQWDDFGKRLLGPTRSDLELAASNLSFYCLKMAQIFKSMIFVFGFVIGGQLLDLFLRNCCLIADDGGKDLFFITCGTI